MVDYDYFVIDIETCPLVLEDYELLDDESRLKLINPIDSKIIAIGLRYGDANFIFMGDDEKKLLEDFWEEWRSIKGENNMLKVVGFNLSSFDIPFITTRSFIHNVQIFSFTIKSLVDLRDKITAYRYGPTRGKLKDFAVLMGLPIKDFDGKDIARLCIEKKHDLIKEYLINDLEITEALYKRAKETNIINIEKW
ncbi:MAG: hypothetical protein AABW52_02430 [Nanoarchaeota archaeon]